MARWKALPEGLDPLVVRLVAALRRMKDDSGLSLDRLARRTGYSTSSWERYLGGRAFPPEDAVRALVEIVGADETRFMVLFQTAREAWTATAATDESTSSESESESESEAGAGAGSEAEAEAEPESDPSDQPAATTRRSRLSARSITNSLTSASVGAAVAVLILQPWHHDRPVAAPAPAAAKTVAVSYSCTFKQSNGQWYAGNSTTDNDLVMDGMTGPEVAEVQCLLQHAGITPGGIDGSFGPKTLHAVIQEQIAAHVDVDGQVGPQTWAALRK